MGLQRWPCVYYHVFLDGSLEQYEGLREKLMHISSEWKPPCELYTVDTF